MEVLFLAVFARVPKPSEYGLFDDRFGDPATLCFKVGKASQKANAESIPGLRCSIGPASFVLHWVGLAESVVYF